MNSIIVIFGIIVSVQMLHQYAFADKQDHRGRRRLSEPEILELETQIRQGVRCPEGQLPDQNGKCREVWIFTCKPCEEGLRPGENGECIEVWSPSPFNIIGAPTYCPDGYKLYNGKCRRVI